ncbi:MAG: TonB C-terminal domain-containing protein [Vicinamibacterales bacterium]
MTETVSDIIAARARQPEGLASIAGWSVVAHAIIGTAVAFSLAAWMSRPVDPAPTVMTISLGGSVGPRTGGMTAIGGRTVQAPTPVVPVRRAETPPAQKTPEMALPTRPARPRPRVTQAPTDAVGRTPTTGAEPTQGPARADTQVRGQGFGLTTGGGGGTGVELEVGDFCCPEYIAEMVRTIQQNWSSKQGVTGDVVMRFTIVRSGMIVGDSIQLLKSSGFAAHELEAKNALLRTRLSQLPSAYPNPTLTLRMTFQYSR